MEETKEQMLANMARQDAEAAHAARHTKKKRTRTVKPKAVAPVEVTVDTTPVSPALAAPKKPRMIRAVFHNRESKGAPLRFSYNMTRYHFKDGEEAEMPINVYRHINGLARTVPDSRLADDGRNPHPDIRRKEPRFAVIPVIIDGEEDMYQGLPRKPIYTVQY